MASINSLLEQMADALDLQLSEDEQRSLLQSARAIIKRWEKPEDIVIAQGFGINLNMCIRVGIDLGLFRLLAKQQRAMTDSEIAVVVGAEELLTTRLLRAAASLNFVDEVGESTYVANPVTLAAASSSLEAGYAFVYDNAVGPRSNLAEFVRYFKSDGYKCPVSTIDAPYQRANDCVGITTFEHWMNDTEASMRFNTFMRGVKGSQVDWFDFFPAEEFLLRGPHGQQTLLFADVAGGHGHDSIKFAQRFPSSILPGRVMLQDRSHVLEEISEGVLALPDRVIEAHVQDFFAPQHQDARNARIYYMHFIMHDWPDEECMSILSHLRDAISPELADSSRILIHDCIMPNMGAPLIQVAYDITMMCHHSGLERDERMWSHLLAKVDGLEVVKFWKNPGLGEGLIEVKRRAHHVTSSDS